jgi:hypothetical protein
MRCPNDPPASPMPTGRHRQDSSARSRARDGRARRGARWNTRGRLMMVSVALQSRSSARDRRHRNAGAIGAHQKPRVFDSERHEISWIRSFHGRAPTTYRARSTWKGTMRRDESSCVERRGRCPRNVYGTTGRRETHARWIDTGRKARPIGFENRAVHLQALQELAVRICDCMPTSSTATCSRSASRGNGRLREGFGFRSRAATPGPGQHDGAAAPGRRAHVEARIVS